MDSVAALVIGAGVVGLAVGRALARAGHETVVLERELAIGQGVSSRNSEVIHAGLYYPAGSLKARLCVEGKRLLYAHCESHGVAHRRCGKLVVATHARQLDGLRALAAKAAGNGVDDLRWLSGADARALEPELACEAALLSPSTGIIDSHGLMLSLQGDLEAAGGVVALGSTLERLARAPDGGWIATIAADGERFELHAGRVVNAAGLWAARVAAATQDLTPAHRPVAHYSKGCYFALAGRAPFTRLVYPLPQDAWLGVHLTLDLGGQARFGPDAQWLEVDDPAAIDYGVDPARADGFYADVRRYWPGLADGALQPAYSGVRPKIHGPGELAPDFRIDGPREHGLAGLVNLLGIESPGLTSALAIANEVVARLDGAG